MSAFAPKGMGWHPDLPDARDYTFRHHEVLPLLRNFKRPRRMELPKEVDLRRDSEGEYFTGTGDQGPLNSSTAFAVLSLVEYFSRRVQGRTFEGSKLFLYKAARTRIARGQRLLGDTGADLRTTLKVLIQIGVPPEEYWPYEINKSEEEPNSFLYGLAKPLPSLRYFRLDEPNTTGEKTWSIVKSFLASGFPVIFGFPVPASMTADALIPYRPDFDSNRGGQGVVAVGYKSKVPGCHQEAILIRSSWGRQWGDNGNGWLPAAFVRKQLSRDFWTVISHDCTDSNELSCPTVVEALGSNKLSLPMGRQ